MKLANCTAEGDKIFLRLIERGDLDQYYSCGFDQEDKLSMYLTGTTESITKEKIQQYINRIVEDETRYDFLVFSRENGQLVGEVVMLALQFAFETLQLHRVELDVYDYNPRARHVYEKVGFQVEGVKRDGLWIENEYHDVILMSMLENEYRQTRPAC